MAYTPVGLIASITDAQNIVTSYQYDAHGKRIPPGAPFLQTLTVSPEIPVGRVKLNLWVLGSFLGCFCYSRRRCPHWAKSD
jgi:hypothetical protein